MFRVLPYFGFYDLIEQNCRDYKNFMVRVWEVGMGSFELMIQGSLTLGCRGHLGGLL